MPQTLHQLTNTILVGEDDEAILDIITILLTNNGYTVISATEGKKVKETLASSLPNLIIMDVRMPGMNGKDVAKALKQNKHTQHIPIILISAFANVCDMAKDAGVDGYLSKPFNIDELIEIAEQYCPRRS